MKFIRYVIAFFAGHQTLEESKTPTESLFQERYLKAINFEDILLRTLYIVVSTSYMGITYIHKKHETEIK